MGEALTRSPAEVALLEARHVNRLADALLLAAAEYAEREQLSDGAMLGALGVALGRVLGNVARQGDQPLPRLVECVLRQVHRTAKVEFARRSWPLG